MNRITKKRTDGFYELTAKASEICTKEGGLAQVVGRYEDIEEKHGCELVKVMRALTEGCWIRNGELGICCLNGKPRFIEPSNLLIGMELYEEMRDKDDWNHIKKETCLCIFDMFYEDINRIARIRDYGKTWALSKEELELL